MENKKQLTGMAAALVANLIFGFSFIFSKSALEVSHPLIILAARFTLAFLTLNTLWLLGVVKIDLKGKPKSRLIAMGIAQPLLYFILELYGLAAVSSALSGIIIALVPVCVLVISVAFLKEKPTKIQLCCTLLSVGGVSAISILSNDGGKNELSGVLLLAGAVIAAAIFNILSRSETERFSPFERTYIMFLIGCIGFNIIALAVLKGQYFTLMAEAFSQAKFTVSIIYLAVISSVAAFILYNYSTSVISAVRASTFSNIITVVSVLAGIFILNESFSPIQLVLCIPVILGVWGVNFKRD